MDKRGGKGVYWGVMEDAALEPGVIKWTLGNNGGDKAKYGIRSSLFSFPKQRPT